MIIMNDVLISECNVTNTTVGININFYNLNVIYTIIQGHSIGENPCPVQLSIIIITACII